MFKFELGMIVKRDLEYGVVSNVTINKQRCIVEWLHEDSNLKNAWWSAREIEFVADPCKEYRKEQKIIVTTDKGDKAEFPVNGYIWEEIAEYFMELKEKYNGYPNEIEGGDIKDAFWNKTSFDWDIEPEDSDETILVHFKVEYEE